jgi:hypothetical protein
MTEEEEIKAAIKARLKEEGIESEDEKHAPEVRRGHAKPPAPLPSAEPNAENKPPAEEGGAPKSIADQVLEALEKAQRQQKEEEKKKEEAQTLSNKQIAAASGATAGVLARLTGRDFESGLKPSPQGTNIFSPKPSEENIRIMNEAVGDIKERHSLVNKIEEQLRNLTQDPNAKITDFTPDQVQRILQGGEGPTMGTTGAQRGYGYNAEQQRRARHQAETERTVSKINPYAPDPIVQAGQVVPLKSGIQVPTNVATEIAQQQAKAQTEQQRQNLELQRQSELNKAGLSQQTINRESDLSKSRGYRSGLGKAAMGTIGGAQSGLSGYDIYQKWKNKEPIDWQDWSRLAGSLAQTFGGRKTGTAGALATLPWAYKHRDELYKGMTLPDVADPNMFTGSEMFEHPEQTAEGLRTVAGQGRP